MTRVAVLIRAPEGARLLVSASERGTALMAEVVLSGIVPTALPVPVWVCCNNAVTYRRLTDYLTGVQTDLMIAQPL